MSSLDLLTGQGWGVTDRGMGEHKVIILEYLHPAWKMTGETVDLWGLLAHQPCLLDFPDQWDPVSKNKADDSRVIAVSVDAWLPHAHACTCVHTHVCVFTHIQIDTCVHMQTIYLQSWRLIVGKNKLKRSVPFSHFSQSWHLTDSDSTMSQPRCAGDNRAQSSFRLIWQHLCFKCHMICAVLSPVYFCVHHERRNLVQPH